VNDVDPRLRVALERQFMARGKVLGEGTRRVGWKLGMGDAERIGSEVAIGYLTTDSLLQPGSTYAAARPASLHADAELALEFGRDVAPGADDEILHDAVSGFGVALEIVDLGDALRGPEEVVADNVFHRAVCFGGFVRALPTSAREARLVVNGEVRAAAPLEVDVAHRVRAAVRLLEAMGERLSCGDRLITGSVVQVAIDVDDESPPTSAIWATSA
jgi:2-keto-4-pentenoate hydratase